MPNVIYPTDEAAYNPLELFSMAHKLIENAAGQVTLEERGRPSLKTQDAVVTARDAVVAAMNSLEQDGVLKIRN